MPGFRHYYSPLGRTGFGDAPEASSSTERSSSEISVGDVEAQMATMGYMKVEPSAGEVVTPVTIQVPEVEMPYTPVVPITQVTPTGEVITTPQVETAPYTPYVESGSGYTSTEAGYTTYPQPASYVTEQEAPMTEEEETAAATAAAAATTPPKKDNKMLYLGLGLLALVAFSEKKPGAVPPLPPATKPWASSTFLT